MAGIDQSLAAWRASLADGGALSGSDLDELEDHVRETVNELLARGLSVEEALLVALRRVGDPSVLTVEFAKVRPGLAMARRFYWMAIGFLGFGVAASVVRAASLWIGRLSVALGADGDTAWMAVLSAWVVLTLFGLGALWRSTRAPRGILAAAFNRCVSWLERHPALAAVGLIALVFGGDVASELASASVGPALVSGTVWGFVALSLATMLLPVVLVAFLWRLARQSEA